MLEPKEMLLVITVIALTTLLTRALPFLLFPEGRKIPQVIEYLGKALPFAIIGMLVVYCFKNVSVTSSPFGIPELIAGTCVVLVHKWKHNLLLSIGGGTVLYMVLIQVVFG